MGPSGLVIGLINPEDPAAVRLVQRDDGGSIQFATSHATKEAMEHFALHSLCVDLHSHCNVPLEALKYRYEPLGNSFPDFELIVDGQEWAVEVTRIEAGMVSYVEVERDLEKRGMDRALRNSVTDDNVCKALREALNQKARRRAESSRYPRCCLLLVDVVDSVGDKDSAIWNGFDLSSFDVVAVVKRDGSVDYIKRGTDATSRLALADK